MKDVCPLRSGVRADIRCDLNQILGHIYICICMYVAIDISILGMHM